MLRSMFTAISGLNAQQQMLDVTSNNIANSNTTGFKASSTEFETALSQTLSSGGSSMTNNSHRWHQRDPDRPRRAARVDEPGLHRRFGPGDRHPQQPDDQRRRLLHGVARRPDLLHPRRRLHPRRLRPPGEHRWRRGRRHRPGHPLDLSALNSGTYESYSIDQNGNVNAVDSAGNTTLLGQIGLATFANPNGLMQVGDTEWSASASSGAAQVGAPELAVLRLAELGLRRDVEHRPVDRIDQPDRRRARLPGRLQGDQHVRHRPADPREHDAGLIRLTQHPDRPGRNSAAGPGGAGPR